MESTKRKSSIYLASLIALVVALWMLSGLFSREEIELSSVLNNTPGSGINNPMRVRVQELQMTQTIHEIVVSGKTEANRFIELRAETDGLVTELGIERGAKVDTGGFIGKLDIRDRQARLSQAEALVDQRQFEHDALQSLNSQQFTSEVQIAEALARLEGAKASRETIILEINQTTLSAPFAGVIQDRLIELGDFVRSGDVVAYLVDMDPLIITGDVNEQNIGDLKIGGTGFSHLVTGEDVSGLIRYISPVADDSTRTFRVELAVPNPDSSIRVGLTAELRLSSGTLNVHSLSPSLLTLADDGAVGVKTVDSNNRVKFYPVEIVDSSVDGILVTGLPDTIQLITVGQGFVVEGQIVEPVLESSLLDSSANERIY